MAHGTPDWGLVGPKRTTYGLDDLGETAVRLGSIHMWDRRGDVILLDDFEHGLAQGYGTPHGLLGTCRLVGGNAAHGAFSVKLTPGSDGDHDCWFEYNHGLPVTSRLALEFSFTVDEHTESWAWYFEWDEGTIRRVAEILYDHVNTRLRYLDKDGNLQTFDEDVCMEEGTRLWHVGKLVADFAEEEYVRFILDDQSRLLPYPLRVTTEEEVCPYIRFVIIHTGVAGNNPSGYVDAVVLTHNEP